MFLTGGYEVVVHVVLFLLSKWPEIFFKKLFLALNERHVSYPRYSIAGQLNY